MSVLTAVVNFCRESYLELQIIEFWLLGVREIDKKYADTVVSLRLFLNSLLRLLVAEKNSTHQSSRLNILIKEVK